MLATRIGAADPVWGGLGFPYSCGVTGEDFARWARADHVDDGIRFANTIGRRTQRFCADCAPAFRREAEARGVCVGALLETYKPGGRPAKVIPMSEAA